MDIVITPDGLAQVFFVGDISLYIACVDWEYKPVREILLSPYLPTCNPERCLKDFYPIIELLTLVGSNGEEWLW